ncbi:MAG TPA: autotransporter domain-containing protein [Rhizomicrobium sp.]|nr:autotransporter domain-containing protein [Rhizomicrobium sp.]
MKRSFLKRGLLLSAASAVALSVPAFADDLDVTTNLTSPVKTSAAKNGTAGNITIESNGSITITQAAPAVTLDSSNTVSIFGNLSNKGTTGAEGIVIDTGTNTTPATITGSLSVTPVNSSSVTSIDLSGSGDTKTGLLIGGNGTFTGNVLFGSSLVGPVTMSIQGNNSNGILLSSTSTLNGNLSIASTISMAPTTSNDTSIASGITVLNLQGLTTGNVFIDAGSRLLAFGNRSAGVLTTGAINGSFVNSGAIDVESFQETTNQSTQVTTVPKGTGDPIGGAAVQIGASILGGFMNTGPDGVNATPSTGVITSDGGGASPQPVVYVAPANGTTLEIGVYNPTTPDPVPGYSFYNRGIIGTTSGLYSGQSITGSVDPNLSVAGVVFMGTSAANVKLDGLGLFNSGNITAVGRTTSAGTAPISVVTLGIGSLVTIDTGTTSGYVHVGDSSNSASGIYNSGTITASASGALGAVAMAVDIGSTSVVNSITNTGSISASVSTTNPSTVLTEIAYAINDQSGTLKTINNTGTISATTTTPLTATGSNTLMVAADLSRNTTGVTFTNGDGTHAASVFGDIYFGAGADTLTVTGTPDATSNIIGNIKFGGSTGHDTLHVGSYGAVAGQINEVGTGVLNVVIDSYGLLQVNNNSAAYNTLNVNDLSVASNGILNIAVSTVLNNNTSINSAGTISLAVNSGLNVVYSSFIPASGQFVLMQAPTGHLVVAGGSAQQQQIVNALDTQIPWLFTGSACFTSSSCPTSQPGFDQLVLNLTPKSATTLGLSGYAAQVFPYVNTALENDDSLGAAMIRGITSNATAQTAYTQFAPDASGGTRAIAISLTDHATGPVAARQRTLRLYATQPGDLTLWGQEFAQQISDKGSDDLPGYKDSGFGFAMGADGGDAQSGWYGGAFTFYTGNVDQRAPSSSRDNTQWYMLSGYSTWRGKGLFLDTQLTAGYGDLSEHRFISVGGITRQANSKRSSVLAAVGMTTGANLVYGSTTITPNIALDGLTMREEGYTETGGNGTTGDAFDLHVNPVVMSSARAFVGVNARQDVNFGSFYMQPELRAGYRYDFLADRIDLTAYFPGVSSTATGPGTGDFTITGPKPSKGSLLAGASISATTGAWSIGVNYDMLSGSRGSMTQVGTISLVGRI